MLWNVFSGQREPVQRGRIQTIGFRRSDIPGVGGQQQRGLVLQGCGNLGQRAILGGGVSPAPSGAKPRARSDRLPAYIL